MVCASTSNVRFSMRSASKYENRRASVLEPSMSSITMMRFGTAELRFASLHTSSFRRAPSLPVSVRKGWYEMYRLLGRGAPTLGSSTLPSAVSSACATACVRSSLIHNIRVLHSRPMQPAHVADTKTAIRSPKWYGIGDQSTWSVGLVKGADWLNARGTLTCACSSHSPLRRRNTTKPPKPAGCGASPIQDVVQNANRSPRGRGVCGRAGPRRSTESTAWRRERWTTGPGRQGMSARQLAPGS
mmetsp:Transcript_50525/g.163723  ORF Transcript_50525/g.163723 Transcript_50525/m.163723 type:complete len:243 (+) Transcript_50525:317-1045(+)